MPDRPTSDPKQFIQGAPVLHVADVKATAAYYRDILGFRWDFGDEEYSVVWRDNSAIHLARGGQRPPDACRPTRRISCGPIARSNRSVVPFWRRARSPAVSAVGRS